jgi:predicted nuclease with TOPRIM domain
MLLPQSKGAEDKCIWIVVATQSLNQKLVKEVNKLKQEKEDSREELKKKNEEIKKLHEHNQNIFNNVKNVKKAFTSKDEDITKLFLTLYYVKNMKRRLQSFS